MRDVMCDGIIFVAWICNTAEIGIVGMK